jgi:hypothetical protein
VRKQFSELAFLSVLRHSRFSKLRIANGWNGFESHPHRQITSPVMEGFSPPGASITES